MRTLFLFYLIIKTIVAFHDDAEINYCDDLYLDLCRNKGLHVGCQFPETWDDELALLAQRLADQCQFVHDDCRATARFPYAGQTVGEARWRTNLEDTSAHIIQSLRRIIDAWWAEKKHVSAQELIQPFKLYASPPPWGHFSQLAVWSLEGIGCGAVLYGPNKLLLVCDFSHTNMLGQRTLRPGPLLPCPEGMERNNYYTLLCANKIPSEVEQNNVDMDVPSQSFDNEDQYMYIDPSLVENDRAPKSSQTTTEEAFAQWNPTNLTTNYITKFPPLSFETNDRVWDAKSYLKRAKWKSKIPKESDIARATDLKTEKTEGYSKIDKSQYYNRERNRQAVTEDNEEEETTEAIRSKPRHKYHKTSTRVRRPGAGVLLSTEYYPKRRTGTHTTRAGVSLSLDAELAQQLFKDTGFTVKDKQ